MKKIIIFILLASSCFGAWDAAKPSSSTSLRNSNPEILANWSALEVALSQDHTFATGSPDGKHTQITFTDPISTPGDVANEGVLYIKDSGASVIELHFKDESGNEIQLTSGGDLFSSTGLTVTTNATFNGGITLGAGDDLIGSATSDITINTDKFTVDGVTGNTVVAGTLTITGEATIGDSSQMATSAAPTDDADLANKKYVDDTPHSGGIVQIVNTQTGEVATGSTIIPYDDTIPQKTEGDEYMTLAITPTNASNKLKIEVVAFCVSTASNRKIAALFQDTTTLALAAGINFKGANSPTFIEFTHYMTAGTTSATTFKVRIGAETGGTLTFNGQGGTRRFGGVMASSITITEIKI